MESLSAVTLTDRELDRHLAEATAGILSFGYRAPDAVAAEPAGTLRGRSVAYRPLRSLDESKTSSPESEFSLAERIRGIVLGDELYTDVEHHVLRVIRRALQVHAEIYRAYEMASGLDRLKAENRAGRLAKPDEVELKDKVETACAVSGFALHAYLVARLQDYQRDATDGLSFEVEAPRELPLAGRSRSLHAGLHHLYRAIDAHARDDASLVKAVHDAARSLAERLATLRHSLGHLEFYTRYHYRIEPEGVLLSGFALSETGVSSDIQVQSKRPEDVVGNHVAKLEACRIAQRLACYDPERQQNPFVELGGFVFSFIGDGQPGTGKTTLIQMIVTLLAEYTQVAGQRLCYENFSVDEISDYQGRSGQNAKRFCQSVLDPRGVGFGTIDDVDQVCGSRYDKNASAGQLEVTAVFMQEFAGAKTIVRGNASFGLFSNYPEKVDGALRQRAQARFVVDGPRTREDFTDLLHILLERDWSLPLGAGYEPRAAQQVRRMIQDKYAEHDVPKSPALRRIYEELRTRSGSDGKLSSWREFGQYLHELQQHDETFTGRAIKNIADAVRSRMMAFDLPTEWLEKREPFFGQSYETRLRMLEELRGEITPEVVIQEIHRYADSEARYASAAQDRELEDRTRAYVLDGRARRAAAERDT
jgi:hypothetical protein